VEKPPTKTQAPRATFQGKNSLERKIMRGLCARFTCTTMFQIIAGTKEGERHHLEGRIAKIETVSNLCANKKNSHKYHARGA